MTYRLDVAEILEGLSAQRHLRLFEVDEEGWQRKMRLLAGAHTLRWIEEFDNPSQVDALRERIQDLEAALDDAPSDNDVAEARAEGEADLAAALKVVTAVRAFVAQSPRRLARLADAIKAYDAGK